MEFMRRLRIPEAKAKTISSLFAGPRKEDGMSNKPIESSSLDMKSTCTKSVVVDRSSTHNKTNRRSPASNSSQIENPGPTPTPPPESARTTISGQATRGESNNSPNYKSPARLSKQAPGSNRTESPAADIQGVYCMNAFVTPKINNRGVSQPCGQSSQESACIEQQQKGRQQQLLPGAAMSEGNTTSHLPLDSNEQCARRMVKPKRATCKRNSSSNGRAPEQKQHCTRDTLTTNESKQRRDRYLVEDDKTCSKPSNEENIKSLPSGMTASEHREQLKRRNSEPASGMHSTEPKASTSRRRPRKGNMGSKPNKVTSSSSSRGTVPVKRSTSANRLQHLHRMCAQCPEVVDDRPPFLRPPLIEGCSDFIGELDEKDPPADHLSGNDANSAVNNKEQGLALIATLSHSGLELLHAKESDTKNLAVRGQQTTASASSDRKSNEDTRSGRFQSSCAAQGSHSGEGDAHLECDCTEIRTASHPSSGGIIAEMAPPKRLARMSAPPVTKRKTGKNNMGMKKAWTAATLDLEMAARIDPCPVFQLSTPVKNVNKGVNHTRTLAAKNSRNHDQNAAVMEEDDCRFSSLRMNDVKTSSNDECSPVRSLECSFKILQSDLISHQSLRENALLNTSESSHSDHSRPVKAPASEEEDPSSKLDDVPNDLQNRSIPSSPTLDDSNLGGGMLKRRASFTAGLMKRRTSFTGLKRRPSFAGLIRRPSLAGLIRRPSINSVA